MSVLLSKYTAHECFVYFMHISGFYRSSPPPPGFHFFMSPFEDLVCLWSCVTLRSVGLRIILVDVFGINIQTHRFAPNRIMMDFSFCHILKVFELSFYDKISLHFFRFTLSHSMAVSLENLNIICALISLNKQSIDAYFYGVKG